MLQERHDDQILALEMLAVALGVQTFLANICKKDVVIWTDNVGCEFALRKKAAKAADHNAIVHWIWQTAAKNNIGIWVERVASKDSIANGPTRPTQSVGDIALEMLKAKFNKPRLPCDVLKTLFANQCWCKPDNKPLMRD